MQLIGTGVDIVDSRRIRRIYTQYSQSFAQRILHTTELAEFPGKHDKTQYLASRFSVKEAVAKAFGLGMRGQMSWKNIYVTHDFFGKPVANFEKSLQDQIGIDELEVSISISHEKHYTIAYAIAFDKSL